MLRRYGFNGELARNRMMHQVGAHFELAGAGIYKRRYDGCSVKDAPVGNRSFNDVAHLQTW